MNKMPKRILFAEAILYLIALLLHVCVFDASIGTAGTFLVLAIALHYGIIKILKINATENTEKTYAYLASSQPIHTKKKRHIIIFSVTLLLCYIALALLFYTAWVNGDEIACLTFQLLSIKERIILGCSSYFRWVPRIGEQIIILGSLSLNRWQHWIISPLFILLVPLGFLRIVKKPQDILTGKQFVLFVLFIVVLQMAMDGIGTWSNYKNYVSFSTYIWPTATTIYLLSFFNSSTWLKKDFDFSIKKCILLFLLGLYSGWGCECVTVIVLPMLLVWFAYQLIKKRPCPYTCLSGILGFTWGAMLMFVSTAHKWRTIKVCKWNRSIKPEEMSDSAIWEMVTNITPDTLGKLGGIDGLMLHGIPYHLHIFFLPIAAEKFWNESYVATYILIALCILSFFSKGISKKKIAITFLLSMGLAWICACSYLAQTIPTPTSFVSPVYFILAGCGYLFYNLMKEKLQLAFILTIFLTLWTMWHTLPPALEAWEYKGYEQAMYREIIRQREAGIQDIKLNFPYTKKPKDTLGFINPRRAFIHPSHDMQEACRYFGVRSISMEPPVYESQQNE